MLKRLLCILSLASVERSASSDELLRFQTGAEIRAKFVGVEMTVHGISSDVFLGNGVLISTVFGKGSTGSWSTENDLLCLQRSGEPRACYEVSMGHVRVRLHQPVTRVIIEGTVAKYRPGKRGGKAGS